jgi:hypothetical protein
MYNQVLSILLATSIIACPVYCRTGESCCAAIADSTHRCCDGHHNGESSHSPNRDSSPADHGSGLPEKYCQCICGGAVVDDTSMQNVHWDAPNLITLLAAEMSVAVAAKPQHEIASLALLSDNGANPGRALRCRMMSFLC